MKMNYKDGKGIMACMYLNMAQCSPGMCRDYIQCDPYDYLKNGELAIKNSVFYVKDINSNLGRALKNRYDIVKEIGNDKI